jgi:hypothetical protein
MKNFQTKRLINFSLIISCVCASILILTINQSTGFARIKTRGYNWQFNALADIAPGGPLSFGDTDHDGRNEIMFETRNEQWGTVHWKIMEYRGGNNYEEVHKEYVGFLPWVIDDIDNDGLSNVIGQYGTGGPSYLRIYESPDYNSLPTNVIWQSPPYLYYMFEAIVGDLDQDGKKEVFFDAWKSIIAYENNGDNSFVKIFEEEIENLSGPSIGEKVIYDIDQDGKNELIFTSYGFGGDNHGRAYIYKAFGDNNFVRIWEGETNHENPLAVEVAHDITGNGKPEIVIAGNRAVPSGGNKDFVWRIVLLEHDNAMNQYIDSNNYHIVAEIEFDNGLMGSKPSIAVADFNMDGNEDILLYAGPDQIMYSWNDDSNSFEEVWHIVREIGDYGGGAYGYDLNKNNFPEAIIAGSPPIEQGKTTIFEYKHHFLQVEDCY